MDFVVDLQLDEVLGNNVAVLSVVSVEVQSDEPHRVPVDGGGVIVLYLVDKDVQTVVSPLVLVYSRLLAEHTH